MKKFIDSVDLVNTVVSSSVESVELDMTHMDRLGAELHNNGSSLVAVIYFQGSNDKENWTRIDAANFGVLNATTTDTIDQKGIDSSTGDISRQIAGIDNLFVINGKSLSH